MKKNIFVALDFSNFEKAVDVANQVKNDAAGLKITNELFAICGKEGLKKLTGFGLEIFLDLKIDKLLTNKSKPLLGSLLEFNEPAKSIGISFLIPKISLALVLI